MDAQAQFVRSRFVSSDSSAPSMSSTQARLRVLGLGALAATSAERLSVLGVLALANGSTLIRCVIQRGWKCSEPFTSPTSVRVGSSPSLGRRVTEPVPSYRNTDASLPCCPSGYSAAIPSNVDLPLPKSGTN